MLKKHNNKSYSQEFKDDAVLLVIEHGQQLIYDYVSLRIKRLRGEKETFESSHPNGVFDVNQGDALYYFLMLRNLIRRGVERIYGYDTRSAENVSDELRFLLSIPAVCRLAHEAVRVDGDSPGQENELLRLAIRIGNEEASSILMQPPNVRRLTEHHDYCRGEDQGDLDGFNKSLSLVSQKKILLT